MCCKCLISGFLFTTFFPLLFIIISTSSKLKLCFLSIVCLARAVLTLFPYVTCEAIYFVDIIFGFLWIDFVLYPAKTNFYFISESPGNIAYIYLYRLFLLCFKPVEYNWRWYATSSQKCLILWWLLSLLFLWLKMWEQNCGYGYIVEKKNTGEFIWEHWFFQHRLFSLNFRALISTIQIISIFISVSNTQKEKYKANKWHQLKISLIEKKSKKNNVVNNRNF